MSDRLLTPQQELFLSLYTNPKSDTFSNAYQSAKKAGYSEEYSQNLTGQLPDWLSESISDITLLRKAEKVLNKTLEMEATNQEGKVDSSILSIQNKTAQFVAERVGKTKYSTRTEHTGAGGKDLQFNVLSFDAYNHDSPQSEAE